MKQSKYERKRIAGQMYGPCNRGPKARSECDNDREYEAGLIAFYRRIGRYDLLSVSLSRGEKHYSLVRFNNRYPDPVEPEITQSKLPGRVGFLRSGTAEDRF